MNSNTPKAPWLSSYENVPHHLEYPDISMFELIEKNAVQGCYLHEKAYDFMGKNITYLEFIEDVNICAKALKAIGIKKTMLLPSVCRIRRRR